MKTKPVLILIAGPNGSGKTTITEQLRKHVWMDGCVYVNPDIIAEEKYGGWNLPEASLKAAQEAERIRKDCFAKRKSLAFETFFPRRTNSFCACCHQSWVFCAPIFYLHGKS